MHFTTLSIKIANENLPSLCGIDLVKVQQGRIYSKKSWLFQPTSLSVTPYCHKRYHLKLTDFIDAPSLLDIWPEILSELQNTFILCHKASETFSKLLNTLEALSLPFPSCEIGCTLMISKRLYPNFMTYSLDSLMHDLSLKQYLDPLSTDAEKIAKLTLHMVRETKAYCISDLMNTLKIQSGSLSITDASPLTLPSFDGQLRHSPQLEDVLTSTKVPPSNTQLPYVFAGKTVVFTGPLESMARVDAVKKLHALGGIYASAVTSKTDAVLTNVKNPETLPLETLTSKLRRALILKSQGQAIDILDESVFLDAIHSAKV